MSDFCQFFVIFAHTDLRLSDCGITGWRRRSALKRLVAAGSVAHATDVAADLVDRARALLDGLPLGPAERAEFVATCHHILHREA